MATVRACRVAADGFEDHVAGGEVVLVADGLVGTVIERELALLGC